MLIAVAAVLVPLLGVALVGVLARLGVAPLAGILLADILLAVVGVLAGVGTSGVTVGVVRIPPCAALLGVVLLGVVLRCLGLGPRPRGQGQRARGQRPGTLGALRRWAEHHRARRVLGPYRAEIPGYRARELGLAAVTTGQGRQPGVGRRPGKLAGIGTRAAGVVGLRATLQGVDQPRQLLHRQPERAGAGSSLPDAEDRDSGVGVPAQPHAAGAAAHVEENLAEPGQRSCVRR